MTNEMQQSFSVIIIGGGPGGISAAMGFLEARVETLLLDNRAGLGGQAFDIPSVITNLAGGSYKNGAQLAEALGQSLDQARHLADQERELTKTSNNASLLTIKHNCQVQKIRVDGPLVTVVSDSGIFLANYLIVATGYRERELPPPGNIFQSHWHSHSDSLPEDLQQKKITVIGGGDSALLKAMSLAPRAKQVNLVHRSEKFKSRPDLVAAIKSLHNCTIYTGYKIKNLVGVNQLESIVLENTADSSTLTVETDEVIVKVGYEPNTELLQSVVNLNDSNHVIVSRLGETSNPRIFAVGDIISEHHPRLATAAGQGMTSAGAVINNLFAEQRS